MHREIIQEKNIRKYRIEKFVIRHEDIVTDDFMSAFLNLYEILSNSISSSRSRRRAYILTNLAEDLLNKQDYIIKAKERWENVRRTEYALQKKL